MPKFLITRHLSITGERQGVREMVSAHSLSPSCCFCVCIGLSNKPSINSSVACTTSGSGLGNGNPVAEDDLAILMISTAGSFASEAMVCVVPLGVGTGEAAADGPREDEAGVCAVFSAVDAIFFDCGVAGSRGADRTDDVSRDGSSPTTSLSNTSFASATFARSTSALNRHIARSRLGRLIRRSVSSACRVDSNLLIAANIRSRSETGGTEPDGEDVRGGVESDADTEIGVEGCSGADAVALSALRPSRRESCEVEGDGDFSGDNF